MILVDGSGAVGVLDRASTEAAPYKALLAALGCLLGIWLIGCSYADRVVLSMWSTEFHCIRLAWTVPTM